MARWKRVVRGILGMGVTFGAIGGGFFAVLTAVAAVFGGLDADEPFFPILAGTVWGFGIGVTFSSVLAIVGSRLSFDRLSVPRVAGMGGLGGLVLAAVLVGGTTLAGEAFTGVVEAFTILPLIGAGAGTASLLIARRAGSVVGARGEMDALGHSDGDVEARLLEEG